MSRCRAHSGTCDWISLPVGMLSSESFSLVSVGLPPWQENGYEICSAITQWSESHRTYNYTLLSHLRFPQPWGSGSHIYILQEQGGTVIPPGIEFPLQSRSWSYFTTDGQSLSMSWWAHSQTCDQILLPVRRLLSCFCGAPSLTRGRLLRLTLKSCYDRQPVSQYVLVLSPLWDLRPDINSVWNLLSCLCGAPSLTRGRVCLLSVTVSSNCPSSS
jgi:hypothetical protein